MSQTEQSSIEFQALKEVERAARELNGMFESGKRGGWKLKTTRLDEEAASAMLILHDCLNDVRVAREDPATLKRYYAERTESGPAEQSCGLRWNWPSRMPRCRGVLGLLFGHKFKYSDWVGSLQPTANCLRCGMPVGGDGHES